MLKIEAWRPLSEARYWIGWQDNIAHVWAWVGNDLALSTGPGERAVPESALYAPDEDGARLVACLEGVEGQIWRDGQLQASRWWARTPSTAEWGAFTRAAGQAPEPTPDVQKLRLDVRPWARRVANDDNLWAHNERTVVWAAATLLALTAGWQLGALWQTHATLDQVEQQLAEQRTASAEQLAARDQALSARARTEDLLQLSPQRSALQLLREVVETLPENVELREWQHQADSLSLLLAASPAPDPETLVRALQDVSGLSEITAERSRQAGQLVLSAALDRPWP
ncbi:hypothetical protein [Wenzhouxiangella limi]|nr:hypothetical protein [Wenzhouxiangella limi]